MRISDWSSDVCSSDLVIEAQRYLHPQQASSERPGHWPPATSAGATALRAARTSLRGLKYAYAPASGGEVERAAPQALRTCVRNRSEEHTSELQSIMRISYDVRCLKKKQQSNRQMNRDMK